ncbi:MAG: DNA-binding protein, partial [Ruminiclostridium sp.]|nr:DNA-binding protein [Ruminiclostridium sp.]
PREVEGSYMPCFLAGESQARAMATALEVPFFSCSHQQGHIAAAAWSAGRMDLLDKPHLVWHLSGGTTELLHVVPDGVMVKAECIGGTSDISAGQLIDRTGKRLGLAFPAGKAVDALSLQAEKKERFKVKVKDCTFSFSGIENKMNALADQGWAPADICWYVLASVIYGVEQATKQALELYPGLPVLCAGGVASNQLLRQTMVKTSGAVFAEPRFSTDNAMGVAILTWRQLNLNKG